MPLKRLLQWFVFGFGEYALRIEAEILFSCGYLRGKKDWRGKPDPQGNAQLNINDSELYDMEAHSWLTV
jgi:hypothetical protein